jgi:RNA polymerase sigma-70 factor (ECF subfamily)
MSESPAEKDDATPKSDGQWEDLRSHIYAGLRRKGARRDEAEDLTQETLARVVSKERVFPLPQMLLAFAGKVAKNLWVDRVRKKIRRDRRERDVQPSAEAVEQMLEMADAREPSLIVSGIEDARRLHEALLELLPLHRDVLDLVVFRGMDYEAVAQELGIPRGTVKSRVHYAIQYLKHRVAGRSVGDAHRGGESS